MSNGTVNVINSILVGSTGAFMLLVLAGDIVFPMHGPARSAWLICAVIALAGGCSIGLYWNHAHKPRPKPAPPDQCPNCGYNLTGNVSGRCPECGTATGDTKVG